MLFIMTTARKQKKERQKMNTSDLKKKLNNRESQLESKKERNLSRLFCLLVFSTPHVFFSFLMERIRVEA